MKGKKKSFWAMAGAAATGAGEVVAKGGVAAVTGGAIQHLRHEDPQKAGWLASGLLLFTSLGQLFGKGAVKDYSTVAAAATWGSVGAAVVDSRQEQKRARLQSALEEESFELDEFSADFSDLDDNEVFSEDFSDLDEEEVFEAEEEFEEEEEEVYEEDFEDFEDFEEPEPAPVRRKARKRRSVPPPTPTKKRKKRSHQAVAAPARR